METDLYLPVKAFLEGLGLVVKGEIGGCDVVGLADGEPPVVVICELKQSFSLELLLQAVDRATAADEVWLAARASRTGRGRESDARFRNLCRRLGFGLIGVRADDTIDLLLTPISPFPRKDLKRRSRLIREHERRKGDPVTGGLTRKPQMTAYRQRALAVAGALSGAPMRIRDLTPVAADAATILRGNVYGWFERVDRGIYGLTDRGRAALDDWAGR